MKKLFWLLLLTHVCTFAALSQTTLAGRVAEVTDGRTLVVETNTGRIVAQLQYIEVPEAEQPLHKLVTDHLSKIALGKSVEFKLLRLVGGKTIGLMTMDGVDLSAQMIRDGGAWHEPASTSGQHPSEASEYDRNQRLAKAEKRGVWSIPGLKTPWDVRAEQTEKVRQIEIAKRITHPTLVGVDEFHSDTRRPSGRYTAPGGLSARQQMDAWVGTFAESRKEGHGLQTHSDPQGRFSVVYTSPVLIDFSSTKGNERLECRAMYITVRLANGRHQGTYVIGFRAISEDYRFSRGRSRLTVLADKQAIALGSPLGVRSEAMIGAQELMFYRTSWASIKKIGSATRTELRIDKLSGTLSDESRDLFKQLATATQ